MSLGPLLADASAPASLMLMGEHAVLSGSGAIVMAVDQRLRVRIYQREDQNIHLHSSQYGEHVFAKSNPMIKGKMDLLIAIMEPLLPRFTHGLSIQIDSAILLDHGLGTSGAVSIALLQALYVALKEHQSCADLFEQALKAVRLVQKQASGGDLVAALYGGVHYYRSDPLYLEPLPGDYQFALAYSGQKTPTQEVLAYLEGRYRDQKERLAAHLRDIGRLCTVAKNAWGHDQAMVAQAMVAQNNCFCEMGLIDAGLDQALRQLAKQKGICASKVSGAGLGDCALGMFDARMSVELDVPDLMLVPKSVKGVDHVAIG